MLLSSLTGGGAGTALEVDSTGFHCGVVNARDQNFNAAKLEDLIARANAHLAEYLKEMDATDATEPGSAPLRKNELAAKIAALQEKQEWHKELLAELDAEQKQVSVTDPDTRKMPTAHGTMWVITRSWRWTPNTSSLLRTT